MLVCYRSPKKLPAAPRFRSSVQLVFLALGLLGISSVGNAQTFDVDFSRQSGPPLVKNKFGVYQTPLVTLPRLLDSVPLLREINVSDLRYEMGWGKPDTLAFDQISGTARQPVYDFTAIDAFAARLKRAGVRPLLAMTYCPNPLKSHLGWPAWKDMPSNLESWQRINRDYAAHLKGKGIAYEIWNEPDMPEPNGKMFFSGSVEDYAKLFAYARSGIKSADSKALVGGPAAAWNLSYLKPILSEHPDFASIHGYDNLSTQLAAMRGALQGGPKIPIYLTEYASFTDFPPNGPQSRAEAAMCFFRDVKGLLTYPDVTKVYWAQWLDAGNGPGMGLITHDGHRKALFNAFKIYGEMPVTRNTVTPDEAEEVGVMASSDRKRGGVVLWNSADQDRTVTVNLNYLPFSSGAIQLLRIDAQNASYIDNPHSENLEVLATTPFSKQATPNWSGIIPSHGVVYLRIIKVG